MNLTEYLDRVGYVGPLEPNLATLRGLHRAHLLAIPYENLDIHLGRPLALDERRIFEKLVRERRGGWCYEMNGLFAWALREAGFRVDMLGGAVNRAALGERAERNHLVLLVELERPYLADVGFGNAFLEPLPLEAGEHARDGLTYRLAQSGERWVFENHAHGGPGFDFTLEPHTLEDFAGQCHALQTSPESGFVRVAVCHRFTPSSILSLRGAVLSTATPRGVETHVIGGADEYAGVLGERFDLRVPNAAGLWEKVWAAHQLWAQQPLV